MKVNNNNNINKIRDKTAPTTPKKVSSETASPSSAAQKSTQVDLGVGQALAEAKSSRAERLRTIEAAVRDGTYKPDAHKIAEQILADAEISARLQNL